MNKTAWSAFFVLLGAALALALIAFSALPAQAQVVTACYAVADNGGPLGNEDTLVYLDRETAVTTAIGNTGTNAVEAIAFAPGGGNLYGANNNRLGILDLSTGAFTQLAQPFGTGDGADGSVNFNDVDGLDYDATNGVLYGSHRRDGGEPDVLIQIDRSTGAHIPEAFGPGVDYVVIDGPGVLEDIDDIAVDPLTGVMFAASNTGGDGGVLVTVNKATGAATVVGDFGVDDIEGLSFFNDGQLYGSTGKDGQDAATRNQLYMISETDGSTTFVGEFSVGRDFEALACLTAPTAVSLASLEAQGPSAVLWLLPVALLLGALTWFVLRRRAVQA